MNAIKRFIRRYTLNKQLKKIEFDPFLISKAIEQVYGGTHCLSFIDQETIAINHDCSYISINRSMWGVFQITRSNPLLNADFLLEKIR